MRTTLISVSAAVIAASSSLVLVTAGNAASGTGSYAEWTESGTSGTAVFNGTYFTGASATRTGGSWQVPTGSSTWLSSQTPFGAQYGSSQNKGYLGVTLPLGGTTTVTTVTLDSAPTAGTWGFALGDIDAENLTITATDASGNALNVSGWFQSTFNYCNVSPKPSSCPAGTHTDVPAWSAGRLTGSGTDTFGAAAWFKPTAAVKSMTFTQERNVSGAPVYQLWMAADIQSSPSPTPTASSSSSPSATPSATPSPSVSASASPSVSASPSASASATANCTNNVTQLVNGSFEDPAIPAKSYRQLKDSAVPGWNTTAGDRLIEIWSDGFQGVQSPTGNQFAEINATTAAELYQDVTTVPGEELTWSLYHRARGAGKAGDTMNVNIGAPNSRPNSTTTFTDVLTDGWVLHAGTYVVPAGQTSTRFGFESGPTASGSKSIGNFLDNIFFTRTECLPASATAEPDSVVDPSPSATLTPNPAEPPVVGPNNDPVPDEIVTPTKDKPLVVDPNGPTIIDPIKESGADPDSTITSVEEPQHGTVDVVDDRVIYTPDEGFRGKDTIVVFITEPNDHVIKSILRVVTGREQVPVAPLGLPKQLASVGSTVLIDHGVLTNAGQYAKVKATCVEVLRTGKTGDFTPCTVFKQGDKVSVTLTGIATVRVRVVISAPAKGKYGDFLKVRTYLSRPVG